MQTFNMGQADELELSLQHWFVLEGTLNLISFQPPAMGSDTFH